MNIIISLSVWTRTVISVHPYRQLIPVMVDKWGPYIGIGCILSLRPKLYNTDLIVLKVESQLFVLAEQFTRLES